MTTAVRFLDDASVQIQQHVGLDLVSSKAILETLLSGGVDVGRMDRFLSQLFLLAEKSEVVLVTVLDKERIQVSSHSGDTVEFKTTLAKAKFRMICARFSRQSSLGKTTVSPYGGNIVVAPAEAISVKVESVGDTGLLPGSILSERAIQEINDRLRECKKISDPGDSIFRHGKIVSKEAYEEMCFALATSGKRLPTCVPPTLATYVSGAPSGFDVSFENSADHQRLQIKRV